MPQQQHERREGEEREHAVAEQRERGMKFDPRIAAKNSHPAFGVPRRNSERDERDDRGEARREVAEHARAKRDANDEVERGGRPGGELENFERVAERTPADGAAPQAEADELQRITEREE